MNFDRRFSEFFKDENDGKKTTEKRKKTEEKKSDIKEKKNKEEKEDVKERL